MFEVQASFLKSELGEYSQIPMHIITQQLTTTRLPSFLRNLWLSPKFGMLMAFSEFGMLMAFSEIRGYGCRSYSHFQKYDYIVCSKLFLSREQNNFKVVVRRALGLYFQQQLIEIYRQPLRGKTSEKASDVASFRG